VIATRRKTAKLSAPELTQRRFNHISPGAFKGIALELGKEDANQWAEDDVVVHTYANQETLDLSKLRRWGIFFGVSKHFFAKFVRAAKAVAPEDDEDFKDVSATGGDLSACHRDARKLANVMQEVGRLDGARIFTNENATKKAMEDAITRWLPSVSRPGDTVFIYYSGHTGQIEDASGDERDGKDEYIVPHDCFGDAEWLACGMLVQQKDKVLQDGWLTRDEVAVAELLHQRGLEVLQEHKSLDPLIELSSVTDDLMAHWLQRLSGRQVVFVSDSCHSAGFAHSEPAALAAESRNPVDLLQNEVRRLQELGQEDQAILTSALVGEVAYERDDKSMGIMTHFLAQSITESPRTVRLEEAFEFCKTSMKRHFEQNQEAGHHPFLLNNCRLPIYLKP
jgi:hypothetical protein